MLQSSLMQALSLINCVILRRIGENRFEVLHGEHDWFYALERTARGCTELRFSGDSAFLHDFFFEAEAFWRKGHEGQIQSGIWSEQTSAGLLRLEAVAAISQGQEYLLISNLKQEYNRRQETLQTARELLLANDHIQAQHQHIHERLNKLLSENQSLQAIQQPIQQAIDSAEFGVCILDTELKPLQSNPALFKIFEQDDEAAATTLVETIKKLITKQFPEFERLISKGSQWSGELYWLEPPKLSKWLQVAIYPVKNKDRQLQQWLWLVTDISRVKYLLQNNEQLLLCDLLTGIPNRQSYWQQLNKSIQKLQAFYLVHVNIKGFKRTNELYGHSAGDQLLIQLVERIKATIDNDCFFARIGGDEFALICPEFSDKQACLALINEVFRIAKNPFWIDQQHSCQIELSAGLCHYPEDAQQPEELIKAADLAAFEAKSRNKSEVIFFDSALKARSQHFAETEAALRQALEAGQFEVYLQPILNLGDNSIIKAEALLRWHRPDKGLVLPDDFIPVAEQTGLIIPIGKWVIQQALQLLKQLEKIQPGFCISVNLSPQQVLDTHLLDFIKNSLKNTNISPGQLELELTEGVFLENYDKAQTLLQALRDLGILVAIDDFGTGYSSLAYLQKLPIDHLKIDRSFVHDLDTNENDKAIVSAVIAMAHSLKMGVIAEGVENQHQCHFLQQQDCKEAQGYLFSKPIKFDNFCQLLSQKKST